MSQQVSQQSVLPPPAIESMMTRLLLTPSVFQEVRNILTDRHFKHDEIHLALLWRAMCAAYDRDGRFDYYQLRDCIHMDMASSGQQLPPHLIYTLLDEPSGLLYWTFHSGNQHASNSDIPMARDLVRIFLTERMVYQNLQIGLAIVNGGSTTDIQSLLDTAVTQQQAISQLDIDPIHTGVPVNMDEAPLDIQPTTVPFIDSWMDGGPAPKEVIGLLGPTGAGKTLLAVTLICAIAERQRSIQDSFNARNMEYRPKLSYFVTYEQSVSELQHRLISCACQIKTSTVMQLKNPDTQFTSALKGDLKTYEIDAFRKKHHNIDLAQCVIPGELERWNAGRILLNDYIRVIDLSGTDPDKSRPGIGFVEEVESLIARDQERCGNPGVATVIIDYVNLAVGRYLDANNKDDSSALRKAISMYVDKLRFKVAGRFNTHVWALNQLNAKGNSGAPTKLTSHMQAAESSAYSHHLAWCCALGVKDTETNCLTLNFSKRRRAGESLDPSIIHIVDDMATMEDGRDRYMLSPSTGRIVPTALANQIRGVVDDTPINSALHETQSQLAVVDVGI